MKAAVALFGKFGKMGSLAIFLVFALLPLCVLGGENTPVQPTEEEEVAVIPACEDLDTSPTSPLCFKEGAYKKHLPPQLGGPPIEVDVRLRILEVEDVGGFDDLSVRFNLQLTLSWLDYRVNATPAFQTRDSKTIIQKTLHGEKAAANVAKELHVDYLEALWTPDVRILRLKQVASQDVMQRPRTFLRLYPNGTMEYHFTARYTVGCNFFLLLYPLDRQTCSFVMAAGLGPDRMRLTGSFFHTEEFQRPLPMDYRVLELDESGESNNNASISGFTLKLRRRFWKSIIKTYFPSGMLTYVSFLSFLVDRNETTARLSMLVGLTLVQISILTNLKVVSILKMSQSFTAFRCFSNSSKGNNRILGSLAIARKTEIHGLLMISDLNFSLGSAVLWHHGHSDLLPGLALLRDLRLDGVRHHHMRPEPGRQHLSESRKEDQGDQRIE